MKGNSAAVRKVTKFLRREITFNSLKPGEHLTEKNISKKLKVSRVPVREAFRILQSEGFLEVIANRGCFVSKISLNNVLEISVVYRLMVPVVLERAIPRYNSRTFQKAEAVLKKLENGKEFSEVGYLLWDFAKTIYSPSNMKFMVSVFDRMYKQNIRFLNDLFKDAEKASFKVTKHREFLELCRENKPKEAILLWCDFLDKLNKMIYGDSVMTKYALYFPKIDFNK
jgi:DNA-binding GntR family transcriptional regulator